MNAESQNVPRRKRKAPVRRTPAVIEQREQKPFVFGWGTGLDRHQREALKERVALFAGIALAVIVAALLGWGWYHDNVQVPQAKQARDNQVVATVGNQTIHLGLFTAVATYEKNQLQSQLTQIQQQVSQLQADPKKNAAQIQSANAQMSQIQQEQSLVPTITLNTLLEDYTLFQRASKLGVTVTPKEIKHQMTTLEFQVGGVHLLQKYINQSGLTRDQFVMLQRGSLYQQKVSKKLAAAVPHVETQVRASHILIAAKDKKLAERLYHEVKGGANIAPLAKKYSTDKKSGAQGGDLGWATPSTYVKPFAKAVASMKTGDVRLVKSQFGWHIIEKMGTRQHTLTPTEYSQAQQQSFQNWLQKEQAALHVQRIMDVTKIPGLAAPTPVPGFGQVPGSTGSTGQVPQAPSAPTTKGNTKGSAKAPSTGKSTGKTSTKK